MADANSLIVFAHQHQRELLQKDAEINRLRNVMRRAMVELGQDLPLAALATLALEREP